MKVRAIKYSLNDKEFACFIDKVANKKINAGEVIEVSEIRARQLLGDNIYNTAFVEVVEEEKEKSLKEKSREELFDIAKKLGMKVPVNIKTENLILKIKEKQNS